MEAVVGWWAVSGGGGDWKRRLKRSTTTTTKQIQSKALKKQNENILPWKRPRRRRPRGPTLLLSPPRPPLLPLVL